MNHREFRNQCLILESLDANNKVKSIIAQIEAYEDLLDIDFQVDWLPTNSSPQKKSSSKWGLTAFAFAGLLFIAGAITAVEQIKHNREIHFKNQAD